VSAVDWRREGVSAAHDDTARGEPCTTIEEARRRCTAWLRSEGIGAEDIECAAQGYLAGWQAHRAEAES
jgi:hypothetical protein